MRNNLSIFRIRLLLAFLMLAAALFILPVTALAGETHEAGTWEQFQEAIASVYDGGTITITGGFALEGDANISGKTFTITSSGNHIIDCGNYAINIGSGAEVTIGGELTITGTGGWGYGTVKAINGGKLNIIGGTIKASGTGSSGVYVENGTANISGDASINGEYYGVYIYESNTVNINEEASVIGKEIGVVINSSMVNISGGTITASENDSYGLSVGYNSTANISGGTITASGSGSEGVRVYGGTAKISGSASINGRLMSVNITENGTAEISGGTITGSNINSYGVYMNSGTVDISGGTITVSESGGVGVRVNGGTAEISGGTITGSGSGGEGIRVNGGTAKIGGDASINGRLRSVYIATNGTAEISGGIITANGSNSVGVFVDSGTADISGGTITASGGNSVGVRVNGGMAEISGGTISGEHHGVRISNGTGNITVSPGLSLNGGVYSGDGKAFLTSLPSPATVTAGQTGQVTLSGVDESISYGVDEDTDHELNASIVPYTVTLAPSLDTPAGDYNLVLIAQYGTANLKLTIPVSVQGVVNIAAIPGVTPPVRGAAPVTEITETDQYTGTVSWSPNDNPFKSGTVYTATITLTPKEGYTLTGVPENFFTVTGASSVSNPANSGEVTAVFPVTKYAVIYDANGGTGTAPTESDKAADETFSAAVNTFEPPSGTHKNFLHWNLADDGTGTPYNPGDTVVMPANDLTLYAIWVLPELSGSVSIVGEAKYGSTLSASPLLFYNPDTDEDEPSYQWKRNGADIDGATNSTYTLTEADIGCQISVTVTADNVHATGSITSEPTAFVDKADGPEAPAAPTLASKTHNSVTLVANEAYEFKVDGGDWQDSNVFTDLLPGTEYTFKARVKETATHKASAESEGLTVTAAPPITYTVSFVSQGGSAVASITNVAAGSVITAPPAPTRPGYTFGGWYKEASCVNAWNFSTDTVNGNITLYAKWTYSGGGSGGGSSTPVIPTYKATVSGISTVETSLPVSVNTKTGNAATDLGTTLAQEIFSGTGTAVLTVPSIPGVSSYTVGIPADSLSGSQGEGVLTFSSGVGSITIPSGMLAGMSGTEGKKAGITIGQGDKISLSEDVQDAIGDRPLIQLTLTLDGKQAEWNNPSTPVTVSIPYTPTAAELADPEHIVVWYIDGSGNMVCVPNGHYDTATGTVTFTTTHFSYYAVSFRQVRFNDVAEDAWYAKAVSFIAARDITTGTGGGNFSPDAKLTRGQFIVMLMRAYGIAPDENPDPKDNFADAGSTWYTGYLAAARRLKISAGVGGNMFAPEKEITRQEMFTLLYNALKVTGQLPSGDSGKKLSDFSDADEIASWAYDAMKLLVETGMIGGSGGKLTPHSTATRAQMAQILYNLLTK